MIDRAPEHVIVPPEYSYDKNVGIEQDGSYIGAYTACCYNDPEPVWMARDGAWQCANCKERLHVYAPSSEVCINVESSSETAVQEFIATWLGRNYHDIGVTISLP